MAVLVLILVDEKVYSVGRKKTEKSFVDKLPPCCDPEVAFPC